MNTSEDNTWVRWRSVANLYHAFFTGLILTVVTRRGVPTAEEFVFRVFRRQQEERFISGLEKLGLTGLPPAVAAAQYHYYSNWIGGVSVEYMPESDRKAWIRYPAPRWIWQGTAICGIPTEVSRAMLRGWHANNGVALGNLKLGFVCTKQTVDVQNGLEGYYYEADRDLALDERLVFARHLDAPEFDPAAAPPLPVDAWPKKRLEKAYRNYAMQYVRTAAPALVQLLGPAEAGHLLLRTGQLIGMQFHHETTAAFGLDGTQGISAFADYLRGILAAQGDSFAGEDHGNAVEIRQDGWRLMSDVNDYHPACGLVLTGLIEGLAAAFDRRLRIGVSMPDQALAAFVWRIADR